MIARCCQHTTCTTYTTDPSGLCPGHRPFVDGSAAYYGRLAIVAIQFAIQTGNLAEHDAAYWYTRYAVRAAEGRIPC